MNRMPQVRRFWKCQGAKSVAWLLARYDVAFDKPTTSYGTGLLSDWIQAETSITKISVPLLYAMFWRIRLGHCA